MIRSHGTDSCILSVWSKTAAQSRLTYRCRHLTPSLRRAHLPAPPRGLDFKMPRAGGTLTLTTRITAVPCPSPCSGVGVDDSRKGRTWGPVLHLPADRRGHRAGAASCAYITNLNVALVV